MYQRLGNIYSDQRIGSFESDGTGFAGPEGATPVAPGLQRAADRAAVRNERANKKRRRRWNNLSNEQLADRIAQKEAKVLQLRTKIAAGSAGSNAEKRAARLEQRIVKLREELAARKNPEALNGLGTFDLSGINPLQLGIGAVLGAGVFWFVVRPRLARAFRRKR